MVVFPAPAPAILKSARTWNCMNLCSNGICRICSDKPSANSGLFLDAECLFLYPCAAGIGNILTRISVLFLRRRHR